MAAKKKAAKASNGRLSQAREAARKILKGDGWRVTVDPSELKESLPHVSTGALTVDYLIGGELNRHGVPPCPGFPRGRVSQVWGQEAAGKTTLLLTCAAAVCRDGGSVLYIDWENDIVLDYASTLGVPVGDPDLFELAQPDTLEEGMKIIMAYARAGVDLIVIDSVGAAVPAAIHDRDVADTGEQSRLGLAAQRWGEFLPDLKGWIADSGTAVVGISQLRSKINTGPGGGKGPSTEPQGGWAWKFYSSLRLELRKVQTEKAKFHNALTNKSEERVVGGQVKVKVVKCKLSPSQGREENIYIRQGEGIDDYRVAIEIAIAHNVIQRSGAWYDYNEQRFNGMELLRKHFRSNAEEFGGLVAKVRPFLTRKTEAAAAEEGEDNDVPLPAGLVEDDS